MISIFRLPSNVFSKVVNNSNRDRSTGGRFSGRSPFAIIIVLFVAAFLVGSCARQIMPYHGFATGTALDQADSYVLAESVGGKLDPRGMAEEDQRYNHDNIAYDRNEEGYYQWGKKLYGMGYRDEQYVLELAPRAFKRDLLDTYLKALGAGFDEAQNSASK